MAFGHIQTELPGVFAQTNIGVARVACRLAQPSAVWRQALQGAHAGIGAFIQAAHTGGAAQGVGNRGFPALGPAGEKLRHQGLAIAVHDQAGQAIGLAMHQAHAVAVDVHARTRGDGRVQTAGKESVVNALGLVKAPNAGADFGAGAERCPTQKLPRGRLHPHRLAAVAATLGDGVVVYPGVAAQGGALFALSQAQGFHEKDRFIFCAPGDGPRHRPVPNG